MKLKKLTAILSLPALFLAKAAHAHCPLCTVAAAAAAGGAIWLGISKAVVGVFIGAFAASTGWWLSKMIKKRFIPLQKPALIILSFASVVVPVMAVIPDIHPVLVTLAGDYGSILNRTYIINRFFIGSLIGLAAVSIAPYISRKVTSLRSGRKLPFQGVIVTIGLLIIVGTIMQLFMGGS